MMMLMMVLVVLVAVIQVHEKKTLDIMVHVSASFMFFPGNPSAPASPRLRFTRACN